MENLLFWLGGWAAQKIADAVFEKILEKTLSDDNLQRWIRASQHQLIAFYLTYLLRTQPLPSSQEQPPHEEA